MKDFFIKTIGPAETTKGLRMLHKAGWSCHSIEETCLHVEEYSRTNGGEPTIYIWLNPRARSIIGTCWGSHSGSTVYALDMYFQDIQNYNDY